LRRPAGFTIFNYPVWAFPHFTMLAAESTPGPILLLANIDPQYPGMVGMLAGGGGLDQIGRTHARAWATSAPTGCATASCERPAGAAVNGLRGSTFGRIGGRPMGMYTGWPTRPVDDLFVSTSRDRPVGDRPSSEGVDAARRGMPLPGWRRTPAASTTT